MSKNYEKIISIILFLFLFINCTDQNRIKNKTLRKEYPYASRSDSIRGVIDSIFTFDMDVPKGGLYIKLKNGYKFVAIRNSSPYYIYDDNELKKLSLENILMKGDSIFKPIYKDSLYVFKNNGFRYKYFLPTKEFSDSIFFNKKYENY
jgi:hypothetical protein